MTGRTARMSYRPIPPRRRARRTPLLATLLLIAGSAVFVVAGANAGASTVQERAQAFPVTVSGTSGSVTLSSEPTRIISLSPTATEMLFAVGAGSQVVAVDADSDYPKNAPHTSLSGLSPNVEAIAKYRPDLVIVSYVPAGGGLEKGLSALHVPLLVEDAATTIAGAYDQIDTIGAATGHLSTAKRLVTKMQSQIASAVKKVPKFSSPLTYYFEEDPTYYSVTSSTFIGQIMSLFHLHDIADAATGAAASGGYPQLSAEFIIKADPSMVVLADTICCHQSAASVAARPGWKTIDAVKDGAVVAMNDDIASRWGPRIVDFVDDIEAALVKLHARLSH